MALPWETWEQHTGTLRPGQRKRVDHACGPGRTLLVSHEGERYRAYCFRCAEHGESPKIQLSPGELAARVKRLAEGDASIRHVGVPGARPVLPVPYVQATSLQDWPVKAKLWLLKAGLGAYEIAKLGAYFHPPSERVILPIYEGGELVFYQARSVDGRQPKYMAPAVDRARVIPKYGDAGPVVLTEDILSAFKIGLVARGWSCLGVVVKARLMAELMALDQEVLVWLDPDPPGQAGAAKIMKQLRAYGVPCRNIVSERDPKLHSRKEIECLLTSLPSAC